MASFAGKADFIVALVGLHNCQSLAILKHNGPFALTQEVAVQMSVLSKITKRLRLKSKMVMERQLDVSPATPG